MAAVQFPSQQTVSVRNTFVHLEADETPETPVVVRPRSRTVPASWFANASIDKAQDDALEGDESSEGSDCARTASQTEGWDEEEECHFSIPSLKTRDFFEDTPTAALDLSTLDLFEHTAPLRGMQPRSECLPTLLQQQHTPAVHASKAAHSAEAAANPGLWVASIATEAAAAANAAASAAAVAAAAAGAGCQRGRLLAARRESAPSGPMYVEQSLAAPRSPHRGEDSLGKCGSRLTVRNTFLHVDEEPEGGEHMPTIRRADRRSKTGPAGMFALAEVSEGSDEEQDLQASAEGDQAREEPPQTAAAPSAVQHGQAIMPGMYLPMAAGFVPPFFHPAFASLGLEASAAHASQPCVPAVPQADPQPEAKQTGAKVSGSSRRSAAERTTVVLQNLPLNYRRQMLLRMLDAEGFAGEYDFVYLPMDFKTRAGFGYAFINLVNPSVVSRFWSVFDGYKKWIFPSAKICRVSWSVPLQGLQAHLKRYRNSPLMHESVPDEYRPVLFSGRTRISFPPPTRTLAAPTHNVQVKGPKGKKQQFVA